ncbi:MAG: flagellar basal body rod protein FlgC [Hyphomicrobium aestuarii]|nr:flagellar basal body rod protein FlgC [Hyphomicrobium aestuarii]
MSDDLRFAKVSAIAALSAQSTRLRVVSENLANATSVAETSGGDPYARKTVSFKQELDRATGVTVVRVASIGRDESPFKIQHDPGHPAADANGNVKMPNVNPLVEVSDMREAHRSYEANLQVVRQVREMTNDLIELLRAR